MMTETCVVCKELKSLDFDVWKVIMESNGAILWYCPPCWKGVCLCSICSGKVAL